VRRQGAGDMGAMSVTDFAAHINKEVEDMTQSFIKQ
jgi:hypothetical protein